MNILRVWVIGIFSLGFSFAIFAAPEVYRVNVNGYNFLIVDIKAGNQMVLEGVVKTGFLHDIKPGLSHLLEHLMHNGSKKFPGRDFMRKQIKQLGGISNAHTTAGFTRYYAYFQPEALSKIIPFYGAAFHHPSFEDFLNERGTVKQEVVDEYMPRDQLVVAYLPFLELLPENHFLNKFFAGTESDILSMTEEDARALFESNYNPDQMTWVLAGNFQDPKTPKISDVVSLLNQHFVKPDKLIKDNYIPRSETISFARLKDEKNNSSPIYIESVGRGETPIYFFQLSAPESVEKLDIASFDMLSMILNLDIEGSLENILKNKGWIANFGVHPDTTNNLLSFQFYAYLTDLGLQHRVEIAEVISAYLQNLKLKGIPQDVIDMLKIRQASQQAISDLSASTFTRQLTASLIQGMELDQILNGLEFYEPVTSDSIQRRLSDLIDQSDIIASLVVPASKKSLVGNQGFDQKSEILGINFRRPPSELMRDAVKRGLSGSSKVIEESELSWNIKKVYLNRRTEPLSSSLSSDNNIFVEKQKDGTERVLLVEKHNDTDGAIDLTLYFGRENLASEAYGALFFNAFRERFKPELTYLNSIGVLRTFEFSNSSLNLKVKDNAGSNLEAIRFLLNAIHSFVPNQKEISLAVDTIRKSLESRQQGFNAFQATSEMSVIFDPTGFHAREVLKFVENQTLEALEKNILESQRELFSQADFQITLVGDYNKDWVHFLKTTIRQYHPSPLVEGQTSKIRPLKTRKTTESFRFWSQLGSSKSEADFGGARAYSGVTRSTNEYAALSVLSSVLGGNTSGLNREINGLGYAHGGDLLSSSEEPFIFYGGVTGDKENAPNYRDGLTKYKTMTAGWDRLIAEAAGISSSESALITDASILAERSGLLSKRDKALVQKFELADRLHFYSKEVGPELAVTAYDRETKLISEVTVADVRAAAKKYFLEAPYVEVTTSRTKPGFCEGALVSLADARGRLK